MVNNKFTLLLMFATPIFFYFFQDKLLSTVNIAESFSFLGVSNFWANIIVALLFQVIAVGIVLLTMSIETPSDLVRDFMDIAQGNMLGFLRMLWNTAQTVLTFYMMAKFTPDWGYVNATFVALALFFITEILENMMLGTSVLQTIKVMFKHTYWGHITLGLVFFVVILQFVEIVGVMNRWHFIYGQEVVPTKKEFVFPGEIMGKDFVKNANGKVATSNGIRRQLTKVEVRLKITNKETKEVKNVRMYLGLITDEKVYSPENLESILNSKLYVCKIDSDRGSFLKGINLYVSTESELPEAPPEDFEDVFGK